MKVLVNERMWLSTCVEFHIDGDLGEEETKDLSAGLPITSESGQWP